MTKPKICKESACARPAAVSGAVFSFSFSFASYHLRTTHYYKMSLHASNLFGDYNGRIAVVTGGGSGLGEQMVSNSKPTPLRLPQLTRFPLDC